MMAAAISPAPLVADIGGTNIRLARATGDRSFEGVKILACADFDGPAAAIEAYLAACGGPRPDQAALAVAAPVDGDVVAMTNHPWSFSIADTRRAVGLRRLHVINDFAAVAMGVPRLGAGDRRQVGGHAPRAGAPVAVLGPGTGLGVSLLLPGADGRIAVATEGGHATLAGMDAREDAVIGHLRRSYGHVSAERAVSGPGLVNLYRALAEIDGRAVDAALAPGDVTRLALDGSCLLCREALDMFAAMLGTVAGNLVLTTGAGGGAYVAGGIVPELGNGFPDHVFRRRFEAKGRFQAYMAGIPVYVVTHPHPAFLGLAGGLAASEGG